MTCQFCFDRPIVKATGKNGELVSMVCPVCGIPASPTIDGSTGNDNVNYGCDVESTGGRPITAAMYVPHNR